MLYLSAYEILIIAAVFCLITFGPPAAGLLLAWVRRRRGKGED